MSHLAHIVKLKQDLLTEGVVSPEVQADIAQSAYVKALINVNGAHCLDEKDCIGFNRWILSYWNEVTPNKGHYISKQVGDFFRNLSQLFNKTITADVAILPTAPTVEGAGDVKYTDLPSYLALVQTLIDEANHKLPQYTETSQIA